MQGLRQNQRLQQRLSLSPNLILSIKLMSLPLLELRHEILEELENNPALELRNDPQLKEEASFDQKHVDFDPGQDGEYETEVYHSFIESILSPDETLQGHLLRQIGEISISEEISQAARFIIQNLDEDGFLIGELQELQIGFKSSVFEKALELVQSLEPQGCATKDYQDSLYVQAKILSRDYQDIMDETDPIVELTVEILKNHFEVLAKGRPDYVISQLAKKNFDPKLTNLQASQILDVVRSLEPFPGRLYKQTIQRWIIPDVFVKKGDVGFEVIINDEIVPVLGVSPFFKKIVTSKKKSKKQEDKNTKDYAKEKIKEAKWFMHSLSRRNVTILKVMNSLIEYQKGFFLYGPQKIAPLRMKDIAEELDFHETTISRVANGKYFQCDWGVFEIKYLFSHQVGGSVTKQKGVDQSSSLYVSSPHSKESVKYEIKKIIEDTSKKLSDQKIAERLELKGIKISRRTVAKYRSEMNIASSFER